jgi:hypothetical protein
MPPCRLSISRTPSTHSAASHRSRIFIRTFHLQHSTRQRRFATFECIQTTTGAGCIDCFFLSCFKAPHAAQHAVSLAQWVTSTTYLVIVSARMVWFPTAQLLHGSWILEYGRYDGTGAPLEFHIAKSILSCFATSYMARTCIWHLPWLAALAQNNIPSSSSLCLILNCIAHGLNGLRCLGWM